MRSRLRSEQQTDELIDELSELCGILPEYWDIFGKKHIASLDAKKAILRSMGLRIDSAGKVVTEIEKLKYGPWKRLIEPVFVMSVNDRPLTIPVHIPIKEGKERELLLTWSITDEKGRKTKFVLSGDAISVSQTEIINGMRYIKVNLSVAALRDIGYYMVRVECKHPEDIFSGGVNRLRKTSRVIVTPDTCYLPPELAAGRTWGFSINLYSIRSERNWGVGDFTDLKEVARWTAGLKGGFVGINPLHSIPNSKPFGISPYSPVSRLYRNFIYLDIEEIPEVKESKDAMEIMASGHFRDELNELRNTEVVDYERVASIKGKILKIAFAIFCKKHLNRNTRRFREFKKYISEEGTALYDFAFFLAFWKHMRDEENIYTWQAWPGEYHNPGGRAIGAFRKANEKEVLFHKYVQWIIDGQVGEVAEVARNLGMPLGLYNDLAIGSQGGGSDAWSCRDIFADGADVGAPPDEFSPGGQNWGISPMIPDRLKDRGYELFIQTIRKNMKHSGAIRIDHALGLFRLFWIPYGMNPKEGAYIGYPTDDLLRIIALESVRNKTVVIAEDLGTIGENVRETLRRFQMLSCRLFYFERNYPETSFKPPDKYPEMALCAVTTHDLPTIYGYWTGRDIERKKLLGMYPADNLWRKQIEDRNNEKKLILYALKSQGVIPDNYPSDPDMVTGMTPELCLAIYKYLALTPCKLLSVSLEDIIGTFDQQNMPGTIDSYPNWMQKIPLTLEEIISDRRFIALSEMLSNSVAKFSNANKSA
jgi:4-alpha-glucanotransferase